MNSFRISVISVGVIFNTGFPVLVQGMPCIWNNWKSIASSSCSSPCLTLGVPFLLGPVEQFNPSMIPYRSTVVYAAWIFYYQNIFPRDQCSDPTDYGGMTFFADVRDWIMTEPMKAGFNLKYHLVAVSINNAASTHQRLKPSNLRWESLLTSCSQPFFAWSGIVRGLKFQVAGGTPPKTNDAYLSSVLLNSLFFANFPKLRRRLFIKLQRLCAVSVFQFGWCFAAKRYSFPSLIPAPTPRNNFHYYCHNWSILVLLRINPH